MDDVHVRDIYTDFIMLILRDMVEAYPEFRVVLLATNVDVALVRKYFKSCPEIQIPGQPYPIQGKYKTIIFVRELHLPLVFNGRQ